MSFFGNKNTTAPGGNIFGGGGATANPGGGTNNPAQPGGGLFGNTGGNLFGGGGGGGGSTSTNTQAGGMFGGAATTPSATAPAGGLFGGGANAPSSTAPAADGIFGAPKPGNTTSGGIFGNTAPSTTAPAAGTKPGGLFGGGAPAPTGGLFGAQAPAGGSNAPNPATNTNPLFGGFSAPKPAETGAPKPPMSGFFSQPPASGAVPATGGGLFGLPPKPSEATTAAASAASTAAPAASTPGNLFGGGMFGAKPPSSSTPAPAPSDKKDAPSATAPNLGGLFGAPPKKDEQKTSGTSGAFNLFGGQKPEEKKDANAAQDAAKKGTPSAVNTAVAVPPPSMLRGKTLEEIVNRWTSDLGSNAKEFDKFAAEVAVWDRALIENGNNIAALFSHVLAAEKHQNDINEALNHIEQQQKDLASTLDAYEKVSQEILGSQGSSLRSLDTGPADNERDKNYMLATDLHTHLDDLSGSLTQMIESVNGLALSSKPDDSANDPMAQITQILSSHLESLQWIDGAVREVEGKASDVERRIRDSGHSLSSTGSKSRGFGR